MKFSLISATSVFALFSAAVGAANAAVLTAAPNQMNIYDLVHDGVTSSDGGDRTVTRRDPLVSAVVALESTTANWREASFTGPVDPSAAAGTAFSRIPLGAAPGTRPDDDFATPVAGAWRWNAWQKAHAIGLVRIAPLIGTIGTGPSTGEKPGTTVFVAAGSAPSFSDRDAGRDDARRSSVAVAFAPSSTSTATITVAGAGNFRQRSGGGFSVAAANSLQVMAQADEPAPRPVALADPAKPTLGYHYAPAASATAKGNAVEASFSDAVTANGVFARITPPATSAKIQTSELRSRRGQPGQATNGNVQTSESGSWQRQPGQFSDAAAYGKLIDLTQPIESPAVATQVDGTRTFISASVSANPSTSAALYMANVVNAAATVPAGQTVEAFQVGPTPGQRVQGGSGTTVADPLHGKIMASAGPLNNSLALP